MASVSRSGSVCPSARLSVRSRVCSSVARKGSELQRQRIHRNATPRHAKPRNPTEPKIHSTPPPRKFLPALTLRLSLGMPLWRPTPGSHMVMLCAPPAAPTDPTPPLMDGPGVRGLAKEFDLEVAAEAVPQLSGDCCASKGCSGRVTDPGEDGLNMLSASSSIAPGAFPPPLSPSTPPPPPAAPAASPPPSPPAPRAAPTAPPAAAATPAAAAAAPAASAPTPAPAPLPLVPKMPPPKTPPPSLP